MKLRYSVTSPYVRKVMVVAIETGLAGRIEKIPSTAALAKPNLELAQDNPLIKVPALTTDEGLALYDSPVICEYIDSLHGGEPLFPPKGEARWIALRQQALADGLLDAALLIRYELGRPANLQSTDWMDGQFIKLRGAFAAFEQEIDLLKGKLTIGQIAAGCALGYLDLRFGNEPWRVNHPKLAAWFASFSERPSMRETAPTP